MPKILILIDWFLPGYRGGGPIKSIHSLVKRLSSEFQFYILTSDRDLGDIKAYQDILLNIWNKKEQNIFVYYVENSIPIYRVFKKAIQEVDPDKIYINSVFSLRFGVTPLVMSYFSNYGNKTILAPRGMLQSGAISQKYLKKRIYLNVLKAFGLHKVISFHATDKVEYADIKKYFGETSIYMISNLSDKININVSRFEKSKRILNLLYISRIETKKNLYFLIFILKHIKNVQILLSIYGHIVDYNYFNENKSLARTLPDNIKIYWHDAIPSYMVESIVRRNHLFILPTLGENYGHAIIESLSVGRPVLISDQTPWKNLKQYNAGWELPLSDKQAWIDAIEEAASWDQVAFDRHCQGALDYARAHTNVEELVEKYRAMFGG